MATSQRHAERESTDEATRRVGDQEITRATTGATQRTAHAGSEALREYANSASETWRTGSETASRIAQRSMDELSRIFGLSGDATRHAVEQSSNGAQVFLESTSLMAHTCQDVSGEWMRFVQTTSERHLERLDQLMCCRSIPDCLALQAQAIQDTFEAFLHSARRTSQSSTQAIDQAARRMSVALAPQ
jgi:Phasin protein